MSTDAVPYFSSWPATTPRLECPRALAVVDVAAQHGGDQQAHSLRWFVPGFRPSRRSLSGEWVLNGRCGESITNHPALHPSALQTYGRMFWPLQNNVQPFSQKSAATRSGTPNGSQPACKHALHKHRLWDEDGRLRNAIRGIMKVCAWP